MNDKKLKGTITFIHHDKHYATIEYLQNGKKKTINGNIDEKEQGKLKSQKIIKKIHQFHIGDEVSFTIVLSPRGDKMIAEGIQFLYNNALDSMINKSVIENRFVGYLKKVDDNYFVKETSSYVLLPLVLSPWEKRPEDDQLNEPVFFKLENADKRDKATAALFKSEYIAEFHTAMKYYKNKTIIDAEVYKVTPHGIFVHVVGDKITAKIALPKKADDVNSDLPTVKVNDIMKVIISYMSNSKIVVERVN